MWKERINGVLNATISAFFRDNIMYERQCEDSATCDNDQRTFKAYLSRWMAATTKLAPFTADTINVYLSASAAAAAAQCSGTVCGFKWTTNGVNDGSVGVGEQMCALEIIQSRLISYVSGPVTNSTGGTSTGNSNAGGGSTDGTITSAIAVTQAGRIGAGILTAIWCAGVVGGCYFMMS
jgi:mannan endo-1,6-alpha-mannosidase